MIKRIYRSKLDIENLSKLKTSIVNEIDTFNYKKVVVNKPWGYEYLMFENSTVAIWILYLKAGYKTSMHCHPNKKTSLIVLSGEVLCSTLEGWIPRKDGEGLIIDEAVFHSTKALSKNGVFLLEIESPPNKKDLVRLKDEYGRELKGYEGVTSFSNDISLYEYVDFHDVNSYKRYTRKIKNCSLTINYCNNNKLDIRKVVKKEAGHIISLLQGTIHDHNGNLLLGTADAAPLAELKSIPNIFSFGDIIYLSLKWQIR